ncbi:MAG: tetratricopeptide repeat protein [Candidatus Coatesbacteria bacterium]|nr:MAG: tetratricopeptide repeat protein [Candidatus Coatesbacteria bacterium]
MENRVYVIMLFISLALTLAFGAGVFAAEKEVPAPTLEDNSDPDRDIKNLEREDERLWDEIADESRDLEKRLDGLHATITHNFTALSIIIAIITIFLVALTTFFGLKHELDVRKLRETVREEIKIFKEIELEARRTVNEAKDNANQARIYKDQAKNELAVIRREKEEELEAVTEEFPPISEAEHKKELVEEILKKYPDLKRNAGFLYDAAVKGDVTDENTLYSIFSSLYFGDEKSKALDIINILVRRRPNNSLYLSDNAVVLAEFGRFDEAIKHYDRALELEPDDGTTYANKSVALTSLGRYEEAIDACDKAISLNADDALAYFNRACAYALLGKKDKMLADLGKAIGLEEERREHAKTDPDFDAYRNDPDFRRLLGEDGD